MSRKHKRNDVQGDKEKQENNNNYEKVSEPVSNELEELKEKIICESQIICNGSKRHIRDLATLIARYEQMLATTKN